MPATGYCRLNVYICIMYECLLLQVIIYKYCYKDNSFSSSVYDTKIFISLFERDFKMMKNGVYFIVIALLVVELFEILIYAN